jgi:bifunctional non-homologous end joining protein LigD
VKPSTRKKLSPYRRKRDFAQTAEPPGAADLPASERLRFVIQKHAARRLHYDLRLELDGVFKSWAVTRGPSVNPEDKRLAVEVEDHPLDYGDFEGTIPAGQYGGGTVQLWDRGYWRPEGAKSAQDGLKSGDLKFTLDGRRLRGSWVLVRMKFDRNGGKRTNWLLIKHRDAAAGKAADTQALIDADRSVASGRAMSAIANGKGRAPKPFMLSNAAGAEPDAVWNSNRPSDAGVKRVAPRATRRTGSPSAAAVAVAGVTVTKPDKALWPDAGDGTAVTKLDLAQYYEAVGPWMLKHLEGRPCSVVRMPDGLDGQQFFQRHAGPGSSKFLTLVKVPGDRAPYLQVDRIEALISLAQIAAVELHPWNNDPGRPQVPGRLVFDLDPAPDVNFSAVIAAAHEVRRRLEAIGLRTFCKTTGGKGLHVVTPLAQPKSRAFDWGEAKAFAQAVVTQMATDSPDRYVVNMAKKLRTGKIFLDYLRNDSTATAVAPLSPRARPGAMVSMPLSWSQVRNGLKPMRFTVHSAAALMRKNEAWAEYEQSKRPLGPAIKRLLKNS